MTATHRRTVAEQLVLDHSAMWIDRCAAARALQIDNHPNWRIAAAGVVDGFAVLYLLMLLRDLEPDVAEQAARFLQRDSAAANLPQLVSDWQHAIATGGAVEIPL